MQSHRHSGGTRGGHFSVLSRADDANMELNTVHHVGLWCIAMPDNIDYVVNFKFPSADVTHSVVYRVLCTGQCHTTRLLLRCGPPRYRPSAVQSTIFSCQANKWLVSQAVSVYWLLILSLSSGWRGALHSPPLCSVTGKVLTLLISFFTALCQNIQLQTLKTSAIARHLQPHTTPLIMVHSGTLFFEGRRKG